MKKAKNTKPLMVKLSASLLAACGIMLPTIAKGADGWADDGFGNWILTGTSTRDATVFPNDEHHAVVSAGSTWNNFFIPDYFNPAAITFQNNGYITLSGGTIVVDKNYQSSWLPLTGISSRTGNLYFDSWASGSSISIVNENLSLGGYNSSAAGVRAADKIKVTGDMAGSLTITGYGNEAVGIMANYYYGSGGVEITGNLSGTVTAEAKGLTDYDDVYAGGLVGYSVSIGGDLSGDVSAKATSANSYSHNAYAYGLYASEGGPLTIGGALTGSVTAQATTGGSGYGATAYAISTNSNVSIGSIGSEALISATATSSNYGYGSAAGVASWNGALTISGALDGKVTVQATGTSDYYTSAVGLQSSSTLTIGSIGSTAEISVTATAGSGSGMAVAYGIKSSDGDVTVNGDVGGSISATQAGDSGYAYGISASSALNIKGSSTAAITASAVDGAYGLSTGDGDLTIGTKVLAGTSVWRAASVTGGDLGGSITATATGTGWGDDAVGAYAYYNLKIRGSSTATITATAKQGDATGLRAYDGDIRIGTDLYTYNALYDVYTVNGVNGGDLGGSITATSKYDDAYGLRAYYGIEVRGSLTGSVTAAGDDNGYGLLAQYGNITIGTETYTYYPTLGTSLLTGIAGGNLSGSVLAIGRGSSAYGLATSSGYDINILGNVSGTVTAEGVSSAAALYSGNCITIGTKAYDANGWVTSSLGGDLGGTLSATATGTNWGDDAYGLYANDSFHIRGSVTADITAIAKQGDAAGLRAYNGDVNIGTLIYTSDGALTPTYTLTSVNGGDLGGSITATSTYDDAYGIRSNYDIDIRGSLTGEITATGGNNAYGLLSQNGAVLLGTVLGSETTETLFGGNLSGTISATATGGSAYGVSASNYIEILGELSGSVAATATDTNDVYAYGLYANNNIYLGNMAAGSSVSATATCTDYVSNSYAYGIRSANDNVIIGELVEDAVVGGNMAGSISATAEDYAYGIYAGNGAVSILGNLSGTISATAEPQGSSQPDDPVSPRGFATGIYGAQGVTVGGEFSGTITASASTNYNTFLFGYNTQAVGIEGNLEAVSPPAPVPPAADVTLLGISIGDFSGSVVAKSLIDIPEEEGDPAGSYVSRAYGLKSNASIDVGQMSVKAVMPEVVTDSVIGLDSIYGLAVPELASSNIQAEASGRGFVYAYGMYADGNVTLGGLQMTDAEGAPIADPVLAALAGNTNIVATAQSTDYVSNSYAYGIYAAGNVTIAGPAILPPPILTAPSYDPISIIAEQADMAGVIVAAAEDEAYAIRAGNLLLVNGDVSGVAVAAAMPMSDPTTDMSPRATAAGLYGYNGVVIEGDLSGGVGAAALTNFGGPWQPEAAGVRSDNGSINIGSISGMVGGLADDTYGDYEGNGTGYAYGLYAQNSITIGSPVILYSSPSSPVSLPPIPFIGGDISGTIGAYSTNEAYGMRTNSGDITIFGSITDTAYIGVSGDNKAQGIRSNGAIVIGGDMAGEIEVYSDFGNAAGLYADGNISIGGKLSGSISVDADGDAFGIHAGGTLSNGLGGPLEITGSVMVEGYDSDEYGDAVKAICAHGQMDLKIAGGTLSAINYYGGGQAFAIKALGDTDDTVELTTSEAGQAVSISGIIDLGDNNEGGDTLNLTNNGVLPDEVRNVETLNINADSTGWSLDYYSCMYFNDVYLNTGVFGMHDLHAEDSFTQNAGTTLVVRYDADGYENDGIYAWDSDVTINGGTVRIVPQGYMSTTPQTYTFIESDYTINGEYTALEKPAIVAAELLKTDGGTDYSFTAARRTFASFDGGVGDAMDALYEQDYNSDLMNAFLGMTTDGQVTETLRQLEPTGATIPAVLAGSREFSSEVSSRLHAMRQGIAMANDPSHRPTLAATGDEAVGEILRAAQAASADEQEWQITGRYVGNYGSVDSSTNANGSDWKGHGFMIDIDNQVANGLILGIGAGADWTTVDIDNNGGDADVTSYTARLYGSWFEGPWHVDAQVGYARNNTDSTRKIPFFGMEADGEWDSDVYTAALAAGYEIDVGGGWILDPNVGVDFTRISNDGYQETGAGPFNLTVDGEDFDSLRSYVGVSIRNDFEFGNGMVLRPEARLGWNHEFLDTEVTTGATLMGASFTSSGVNLGRDSAVFGLGLNFQYNEAVGAFVSYDVDVNSDKMIQGVSAGLRFSF